MSTISAERSVISSISPPVPRMQPQVQASGCDHGCRSDQATSSPSTRPQPTRSSQVQPHHHHHHGGGGGAGGAGFFSKLQSAVTTALQSAQAGGAGTDPNQAIQNAIESVLKKWQRSDFIGSPAIRPIRSATTDPTATGRSDSAAPVDPQTAREQFFQTLQSYGVDPQQFHQDFFSALQDSKNGNSADPSSVFQSLPPGSVVDTNPA